MPQFDPLTLPESEFKAWAEGVASGGAATQAPVSTLRQPPEPRQQGSTPSLPSSVTPETQAALVKASDMLNVTVPRDYVSPEGERMGMRPGVSFNIHSGVDGGVRFDLGLDENEFNRFKYLVSRYGPENVFISQQGKFILRNQPTQDGTGGVEDVMVNAPGLDSGDLLEQLGQLGYQGGGVIGAVLGGLATKNPIGRVFTGALGMALGSGLGGGAQDAFVRARRGDPIELGDVAKDRAAQAVLDSVIGVGFAGAGKVATTALEGFIGAAQISNAGKASGLLGLKPSKTQAAANELRKETGVNYPLSPGEAAGPESAAGRLFLRAEATASGRVGSASSIDNMLSQQQKAEDELLRVFFGLDRTMTDAELRAATPAAEEVGESALRRLRTEAEAKTGAVRAEQENIALAGTQEAQLRAGVNLRSRLDPTAIGQQIQERAAGDFEKQRATFGARYDAFFDKPEVTARVVKGDALARAVEKVEDKLTPQALIEKEVKDFDAYGNPVARSKEQLERLDAFVNGKVKSFIDTLKSLRGAKVSANDLKQIRTSIDDAIAEGVAIPGVNTKQLSELRKGLTGAIGDALEAVDPALKQEWTTLNTDYASSMARFDRNAIRELLIKEGEKGALGRTKIAERVIGNSPEAKDIYDSYKSFLGETSPEFTNLKQVISEHALYRSLGDTTPYIDGASLRNALKNNLRPEIAEDVLGANKQELARIGEVLEAAQGKTLDVNELNALVRSRTGWTASALRDLVQAEADRAAAYNNKLIRAAAEGTIDAESIRASDFVRYASQLDPKEAQRVMGVLASSPNLVQDINRLAIMRIWKKAQADASSSGHKLISPSLLNQVLEGTNPERAVDQRKTWRVLAGDEAINGLELLTQVVQSRAFKTSNFKGTLAGQGDVSRLLLKGEAGMLPEVAQRWLIAFAYSGPLKKATTNLIVSQDRGRFLNALIGSVPFAQELRHTFGADTAAGMMAYYHDVVDPLQRRELFIEGRLKEGVDPTTLSEEEFRKWVGNTQQK